MNPDQWTEVDQYLVNLLVPSDPVLEAALHATADAGMPLINVAPNQGKWLCRKKRNGRIESWE